MSIDDVYARDKGLQIEVDKTYTYKELCLLVDEPQKSGKSRILQKGNWKRFFDWENPTTQTFKILALFEPPKEKTDGRENNGGAREGAGRSRKLQEEFEYMLRAFVNREVDRNMYNSERPFMLYFNNNEISKYFGLYSDDFYNAVGYFEQKLKQAELSKEKREKEMERFQSAFNDVVHKISEKRRSLILDKINATEGLSLEYGLIAYKDSEKKTFEHPDSLLDEWNGHCKSFMKRNRMKNLGEVAETGKWREMIKEISLHFPQYVSVERIHKLEVNGSCLGEYDLNEYGRLRSLFNEQVVQDLKAFFAGRCDDPRFHNYIIDRYVKADELTFDTSITDSELAASLRADEPLLEMLSEYSGYSQEEWLRHIDEVDADLDLIALLFEEDKDYWNKDKYESEQAEQYSSYWLLLKSVLEINYHEVDGVWEPITQSSQFFNG